MLVISIAALVLSLLFAVCGLTFSSSVKTVADPDKKTFFYSISKLCSIATAVFFTVAIFAPVAVPQYKVWQQYKEGEAELAKAEQNRQIAIQEAKAKEESAKSLANAEVIRAEGVAKANKIIGDSLQNNDAYIHYLWIEALKESNNDVIYIPTEAGIPITESARFFKKGLDEK